MSTKKRKIVSEIQSTFHSIEDLLVRIKTNLGGGKRTAWPGLVTDLNKLAALAENISQQRPHTNNDWLPIADTLDREGVGLWNTSGPIKGGEDKISKEVAAALRLAAFRLIEAGLEQNLTIETLLHVLQLASKTGASLSEIERHDVAASVLTSAAKYEEQLKEAEDAQNVHQQAKAQTTILYLSSRLDAAWREGNDGVAEFMLQKITENDQRLLLLPLRDRHCLAAKLLDIGKSILKGMRTTAPSTSKGKHENAVKWMQTAFAIVEKSEGTGSTGLDELKRSILRSLARAYYLSSSRNPENLDRAEAALNELINVIDTAADRGSPEHQQLRWMRVAVLKRQKAPEAQLLDAFKSIIDHLSYTETNVTDILQELRTLSQHYVLVTSIYQHAIQHALGAENDAGHPFVDRLLLSFLFHCSRDEDHARAMQCLENAFTSLTDAEFELPKVPTTACLTLLWRFGDRHYSAGQWGKAADWFICGTHSVFGSMARTSKSKCFRKAALCHIQQREYSTASAILRRCPGNEAATLYVTMLAAVHQGLENDGLFTNILLWAASLSIPADVAIQAVRAMVAAPDFDRKMLLLATQIANDCDMKSLLLSVLESLLGLLKVQEASDASTEAIALIRCIVRLVVKLIGEPGADRGVLVKALLDHLTTAKAVVATFHATKRANIIAKDVSWLWRTAYNCAIRGCSEWDDSEEIVSELFDISQQLLEIYCESSLTDIESELFAYLINASFASVAGRVFLLRQRLSTPPQDNETLAISEKICSTKNRIQRVIDDHCLPHGDDERARSFIHILRIFDAELACARKDWPRLLNTIQESGKPDTSSVVTYEAIADILWAEKDCPVEVLFAALEAILHACLDRMSLSVEKFSRWLRAICTILLSRNTPEDRIKAIGYVEQAVNVLSEHSDTQEDDQTVYPMDERHWLLGTAYNTGIECLHASLLDEAKRWFEISTLICRHVPDGKMRGAKISETYTHLLARYAPKTHFLSADPASISAP